MYPVPIWKPAPFLRLLSPLIGGILLYLYFPALLPVATLWALAFAAGGLLLLYNSLPLMRRFQWSWLPGILLHFLIAVLGNLLAFEKDDRNNLQWMGHVPAPRQGWVITLQEPPVEKLRSYKALASVEAVLQGDTLQKVRGKVLLYFRKDSSLALRAGDRLLVRDCFQPIRNIANPGTFNYQRYCSLKNIFFQAYLKKGDWQRLSAHRPAFLRQLLLKGRAYCLQVLRRQVNHPQAVGIAEALLIGYRDDLDPQLLQAYANTGLVHIIAISGLHLGLIYVICLWLLRPLPPHRFAQLLKALLIIAVLWAFALLTGAAAAVLRSAVMFTALVTGKFIVQRYTNAYNTLAASAFLLLCYHPYFIADVGFQLSYLAVGSILVFYAPVYRWLHFDRWLPDKCWSLLALTLSAQVLTFPISLYYFHQFPNLFLLANLIAIPLSSLVLIGELVLIAASPCTALAGLLGKAIAFLIVCMNQLIGHIGALPFAVWGGIAINASELLLWYVLLILLAAWLLKKQARALSGALFVLLILSCLQSWERWQVQRQKRIVVYNVPSYTAIDFVTGQKAFFVGDTVLQTKNTLSNSSLHPSRIYQQIKLDTLSQDVLFHQGFFWQFGGKRLAIINASLPPPPLHKIKLDWVILSKNPKVYVAQLLNYFHFDLLIFDPSNPPWTIERWKNECEQLNLRHFSVPEQGAFVVDL